MSKVRIAVFVSGGGTNLQALIDAQNSGIISSGEIVLVIADRSKAYALERAKKSGINTFYAERKEIGNSEFEKLAIKALDEAKAELIVLAGYLGILSEQFTKKYSNRIINIHPSLIPSFCGMGCYGIHVHEKALEYGVKVTGATVHYVNEIPDGGRIIMQKAVDIKDDDTPQSLQRRVMEEAEWVILPKATQKVCEEILKGDK